MVKRCCVESCRSEAILGSGISLHGFPKNEEMFRKWVEVIPGRVTASSVVCAKHFKAEDFASHPVSAKKHLKANVIPSIFETSTQATRFQPPRNAKIAQPSKDMYMEDDVQETDYDSGDTDYLLYSYRNYGDDFNTDLLDSGDDMYTQKSIMLANISLCKCCLGNNKLQSMWQEHRIGEPRDYGTMLVDCFALPWSRPEDPKRSVEQICESCIRRLRDAVSFKMEVLTSEQLLSSQLEAEDLDKFDQEHDDENTQFDVQTEYLDYEYLEDNLDNEDIGYDDGDSRDGTHNNDVSRDDCDKFNEDGDEINIKDDTLLMSDYRRNQTIATLRKRKHSTDVLKNMTMDAVVSREISEPTTAKRYKGSNVNMSNNRKAADEPCDTLTNEKTYKKIKGYLEDILRYSNATPIGRYTGNSFQCCFCRDKYDSPKNLKHHTLDKHAENVIVHTTDNHIKLDITDLKCLDCYAGVGSLHGFVNHMQIEHRMYMRKGIHYPIVPFKFDSDVMRCALCQVRFKCFDSLSQHMSVHFENYEKSDVSQREVKFDNNENGESYRNNSGSFKDLRKPVPERHRKVTIEEVRDKSKLTCISCGLIFKDRIALLVHKNKYHMKLPVKCQYCSSKFLEEKDLTRHIRVKHGAELKH